MSLLLKNTTYINAETLDFKTTDIFVEEGKNGKIHFVNSLNNPEFENQKNIEKIDCSGQIVTKSFTLGHHHIYSALAKGMPAPKKTPRNFYEILKYIWWKIDKSLDKEMIKASALSTAIACAKSGSTFVIDHHASPNCIENSLKIIADAFDKVGINHLLCYEISDRDGLDKAEKGLAETESYLKENQGLIGLHASFTVGNDTMKKAANLMQKYNSGFHIHVAEDLYDQKHSIKNFGKRVVERLNDYEILNSSKTILGHCLHIDENERKIIKNSKAYIVQNTESNLNNNVGYFNAENLGENIMLGTDGMHSDMLRSAQTAFFVGQNFDTVDYQSIYKRFRNAEKYISENNFKGKGENNLVILDYASATPINKSNFLGHFVFGFRSNHINHVISNGKIIVKNKIIQTVDEQEIMKFSQEQAIRLWRKI